MINFFARVNQRGLVHSLFFGFGLSLLLFLAGCAKKSVPGRWYRGNTHTHTLWSDGNDFPDMVTHWFANNGYDFLVLSDHNILSRGEKWMSLEAIAKRQKAVGRTAIQKYRQTFGDAVETRTLSEGKEEVRLKTLEEVREVFESDAFLLIEGEEISASFQKKPIHLNGLNLTELIPAQKGESVTDVIRKNLVAVQESAKKSGKPAITHINHPNFGWALTAKEVAEVLEGRFIEIYNGHPTINHLGDATRPGEEKLWDIANTIRLDQWKAPPLFGVATDDSHNYHGGDVSPGRGWVMVRSTEFSADALILAMKRGDFYSSSGVSLKDLKPIRTEKPVIAFEIEPRPGLTYETTIIGTRKTSSPKPGEVLQTFQGTTVRYEIPEDVYFARATVTSSEPHPNPSFEDQKTQAWTQPVGWRRWIP